MTTCHNYIPLPHFYTCNPPCNTHTHTIIVFLFFFAEFSPPVRECLNGSRDAAARRLFKNVRRPGKKKQNYKTIIWFRYAEKKQILKKHVKIDEFVFPYVSIIGYWAYMCVSVCEFSIQIKKELYLVNTKKLLHAEFYDQYIGEFS